MHTEVREISVDEFDEMIENHDELLIVDVRAAGEFESGHIPGARRLPDGLLEDTPDDARRARLDRFFGGSGKTLVLCSRDGERSAAAARTLQRLGFENVYSLAGGVARWQAQGFALVTE